MTIPDIIVRSLRAGIRRKEGTFATGVLHLWHRPRMGGSLPGSPLAIAFVRGRAYRRRRMRVRPQSVWAERWALRRR